MRRKNRLRQQGLVNTVSVFGFVAVIAGVWIASSGATARADSGAECEQVHGNFSAVAPPGCTSAVGNCTLGTLTGKLASTYAFTADTLAPAHALLPNVYSYSGHSTITMDGSDQDQLIGSDQGYMKMNGDGTADFVTTVTIKDGSDDYSGASGQIIATGVMNLQDGSTVGTYRGQVCKAEKLNRGQQKKQLSPGDEREQYSHPGASEER